MLMSIVEFRKIIPENRLPKKPVMVNLTSACDQQLSTIGLYDLKLTIGSKSIIHPGYVTENKTPAILGIDAIKAFGLLYSPSKNCFTFETKNSLPIHAISRNSPNNSFPTTTYPHYPFPILVLCMSTTAKFLLP
jgi:hypothetical protein